MSKMSMGIAKDGSANIAGGMTVRMNGYSRGVDSVGFCLPLVKMAGVDPDKGHRAATVAGRLEPRGSNS